MADRIAGHIERLVADATEEAASGAWERARSLAEAVLVLQPENAEAQQIVKRADAVVSPGERRQLTVLFCDVVGSTALSGVADPEIVHDVYNAYQSACAQVVIQHDGHIAQFLGDGVVAYFGYPRAHEDDARRAVDAGLDILAAMREVAHTVRQRHHLEFSVRVAVHTGLVVRAEMAGPPYGHRDAVVGETPNLAARLQEQAQPGTLIISGPTYRLVRGFFTCEPRGGLELRGVAHTVDAYDVTARTLAETRLEAGQPAPFVGRHPEVTRLVARWEEAQDAGSASVLIRGEPGVGKSRLALVFRQLVEAGGARALCCACSAYRTETPLYPIRRLLSSVLPVDPREDPDGAVAALRSALVSIGREEMLGPFADLLGLPRDAAWSTVEIDPPQLRYVVLDTLVRWIAGLAAAAPTLIVMDDLQWSDASTLELIHQLIGGRITGLLVVMTAREQFTASWPDVETMELGPLSEAELRELAGALPEGRDLTEGDVKLMIERSEGVPLFLEELLRAGWSPPSGPAAESIPESQFTVPPALLEPLMARLASPRVELSLVQVMATIGLEADAHQLELVTGWSDAEVRERAGGLVDAQLIEVSADHPTYRFRHQLLRDVAYEMQLQPVRRQRHSAVADVMIGLGPASAPVDAGALAHHLEQAERIEEAVDAHVLAAGESMGQGGIAEAIAQFDHAIELVERVGNDQARMGLELTVRQARGMAWAFLAGYASPGAAADLERCADLCRKLGTAVDGIPGLQAAWYYCVIRGELDRAEDVILVDRRRLDPDPDGIPEEAAWSGIRFGRGEIGAAIEVMESFLASPYALTLGSTPAQWPLPDDPVVNTWSILGLARWIAAAPGPAWDAFDHTFARAERLDFPHGPFCRAYILLIRLLVDELAGRTDEALAAVEEMKAISERHGFALFGMCSTLHGALVAASTDPVSGAVALQGAFEHFRFLGMDLWNPWGFTVLGHTLLRSGDHDGALRCVDTASAEAARTGAHFWTAETHRVRGLARLARSDPGGRQDLLAAADLAARQGARLFELRANLDLVNHGAENRRDALRDLLHRIGPVDSLPEAAAARRLLGITLNDINVRNVT